MSEATARSSLNSSADALALLRARRFIMATTTSMESLDAAVAEILIPCDIATVYREERL
jgi:predicted metal-dependent HD superfamily phosphohydrolase